MALVEPVAEEQVLVLLSVVVVLELALRAVRQARESGRRPKERRDEHRLRAGRDPTGRRRVEGATRDLAGDVALERPNDAGADGVAVGGRIRGTVTGARDRAARIGGEEPLVLLTDAVRAILVLVHLDGAHDRVIGPRAARAAAVSRMDQDGGLVGMRLLVAVARVRKRERRERECADDENRNCQQTFHVCRPLSHGLGPCLSTLPRSLGDCTGAPRSSVDFLRVLYSGRVSGLRQELHPVAGGIERVEPPSAGQTLVPADFGTGRAQ